MAIDWARLENNIAEAVVTAINATLEFGLERALKDVPVRKVFVGGRQTVRFKTAEEIEKDKDLRQRLGLAPEILATPARIAAAKAAGVSPTGSISRPVRTGLTDLHTGRAAGRDEVFGFARTISHPARDDRKSTAGFQTKSGRLQRNTSDRTRAERGLVENRSDRANAFMPKQVASGFATLPASNDTRVLRPAREGTRQSRELADPAATERLSGQGLRELKSGRAISATAVAERLGGGLRATLRIAKASAQSYPLIEGKLVAGDGEHKYAKYQELGTRHNTAHPFLRPRLPEWREELPSQLLRSLRRTGR